MTIPRINIEALRGSGVYVFDVTDELVRWGQAFNAWADSQEGVGTGQDISSDDPQPDSAEVTAKTIFDADNTQQQQGSGDLPPVMGDGLS